MEFMLSAVKWNFFLHENTGAYSLYRPFRWFCGSYFGRRFTYRMAIPRFK